MGAVPAPMQTCLAKAAAVAITFSFSSVLYAQEYCTAQQYQDFQAACVQSGINAANAEAQCVASTGSHLYCGYYPWPSKIRTSPTTGELVCSIFWIRSPAGYESPLPSAIGDVATLGCSVSKATPLDYSTSPPQSCGANPGRGQPIYPLLGVERERVDMGVGVGPLHIALTYDSTGALPQTYVNNLPSGVITGGSGTEVLGTGILGSAWSANFTRSIALPSVSQSSTPPPVVPTTVSRGSGRAVVFISTGGSASTPPASTVDRLVSLDAGAGYRYYDSTDNVQETYDSNGKITSIDWADGRHLGYTYSDANTPASTAPSAGLVIAINDGFGRSVGLRYTQASGQTGLNWALLSGLVDAAGQTTSLSYNQLNGLYRLDTITWSDGNTRKHLYGTAGQAMALTGIVDELQVQYISIGYDASGVALSTEKAGGVNRYVASYASPPGIRVTDSYDSPSDTVYRTSEWIAPQGVSVTAPTGAISAWSSAGILNNSYLSSQSQPAGSGCSASTSGQSYDANGNIASRDDFNGSRMCAVSNLSRNLETARVEGLSNTASCDTYTAANASLPTGSRKTSTTWHPDWRLAAQVAEPGRLTTSVYNGQPDPFNANAVASCAPSTALLPDGKPIAVLCKTVEQATTDADGHLGFSATLQSGVANRVNSWTYNAVGQVLTAKGPRTDVNDTTTYAYYTDTTADHTLGDVQTVTNAVGQITTYTKYNPHGQLLEASDPNGVATVNTYDLRQRLLSTSVGGQTTTNTYDAVGQLLQVTAPDGSWVGYEYDAAHRQTAVKDSLGNRIEYTLDNAGNKTAENVKDPTGTLKRTLARSIDALGRVQQTTGRE